MTTITDAMLIEALEEKGISKLTDHALEEMYDEMLDECYEPIEICGGIYDASLALFKVDEIAYDAGMLSYISSLIDDNILTELDYENYYKTEDVEAVREELEMEIRIKEEESENNGGAK